MARQRESNFSDKVADFLDCLPRTWHVRVPAFLAGMPDRIACVNGRFCALEIKADKKSKRSKLQEYILARIKMSGGYATFVYPENWEQVQADLDDIAVEGRECRTS